MQESDQVFVSGEDDDPFEMVANDSTFSGHLIKICAGAIVCST